MCAVMKSDSSMCGIKLKGKKFQELRLQCKLKQLYDIRSSTKPAHERAGCTTTQEHHQQGPAEQILPYNTQN